MRLNVLFLNKNTRILFCKRLNNLQTSLSGFALASLMILSGCANQDKYFFNCDDGTAWQDGPSVRSSGNGAYVAPQRLDSHRQHLSFRGKFFWIKTDGTSEVGASGSTGSRKVCDVNCDTSAQGIQAYNDQLSGLAADETLDRGLVLQYQEQIRANNAIKVQNLDVCKRTYFYAQNDDSVLHDTFKTVCSCGNTPGQVFRANVNSPESRVVQADRDQSALSSQNYGGLAQGQPGPTSSGGTGNGGNAPLTSSAATAGDLRFPGSPSPQNGQNTSNPTNRTLNNSDRRSLGDSGNSANNPGSSAGSENSALTPNGLKTGGPQGLAASSGQNIPGPSGTPSGEVNGQKSTYQKSAGSGAGSGSNGPSQNGQNLFGFGSNGVDATANPSKNNTVLFGGDRSPAETLQIQDPEDYFTRIPIEKSLFKIVERRYHEIDVMWEKEGPKL